MSVTSGIRIGALHEGDHSALVHLASPLIRAVVQRRVDEDAGAGGREARDHLRLPGAVVEDRAAHHECASLGLKRGHKSRGKLSFSGRAGILTSSVPCSCKADGLCRRISHRYWTKSLEKPQVMCVPSKTSPSKSLSYEQR